MIDTNLYFVMYSVHGDLNDWYGYTVHVFAKNPNAAMNYIIKNYKQNVSIHSIEQVEIKEGMILKHG